MNREQGINYLKSSGFSYEQIKAIEGAFTDSDCISRWALKEDLYEAITNVDVYERVIDIVDRQKAVNVPDNNVGEMDCISRQAVEDAIAEMTVNGESLGYAVAYDILSDLPPVKPEQKNGEWIIYDVHGHKACKCSKCNNDVGYPCTDKYCKYCGAKMEG